jgi:prepilin-type N-terminal cleavage/methylation domain-containing protein
MKKLNQGGFTLVELLIVVFMLVVIPASLFGVPWLLHWAWMNVGVVVWHWPSLTYWQIFVVYFLFLLITSRFRITCKRSKG